MNEILQYNRNMIHNQKFGNDVGWGVARDNKTEPERQPPDTNVHPANLDEANRILNEEPFPGIFNDL
jgi:hypothetical protein